ncbi:MAG TPA: T9SS type A sorting domain-containing protein [Bacteroidota bacterium]|nr:T9SS type A sorting domain-containing protein [Bacteroidota bacterium]
MSQPNFWQQMSNGLSNLNVSALSVDSNGTLYAATGSYFPVVFRSTDNGDSWDSAGQTDGSSINCLETNSRGYIFAGDVFYGVYRSTDSGNMWVRVDSGLTNPLVRALAINSSGDIFAGILPVYIDTNFFYGIYRSTNNGDNWVQVNTGLRYGAGIYSFATNSAGQIFAGGSYGIYRSTDNGSNWVESNNGLDSNRYVSSISVGPNGHIFAGTQDSGIYRSTDDGNTWTHANIVLPNLTVVWSLVINSLGHIFAAVSQSTFSYGVLRSTDDGINWTLVNSGFTTSATVYDLVINSSGYVFAGTGGGGVFRSVQSTTSVEQIDHELPTAFSLKQNYPNPFNPSTSIQFSVPRTEFVTLKIYNILGKDVATLVSKNLSAGTYETEWNAQGFPSGVYFYRLQAGAFIQIKKLILIR